MNTHRRKHTYAQKKVNNGRQIKLFFKGKQYIFRFLELPNPMYNPPIYALLLFSTSNNALNYPLLDTDPCKHWIDGDWG